MALNNLARHIKIIRFICLCLLARTESFNGGVSSHILMAPSGNRGARAPGYYQHKARASPSADPSALHCNLCRSCLFNKVNGPLAMPRPPGSYLGHIYTVCNFMKNICLLKGANNLPCKWLSCLLTYLAKHVSFLTLGAGNILMTVLAKKIPGEREQNGPAATPSGFVWCNVSETELKTACMCLPGDQEHNHKNRQHSNPAQFI